MPVKVLIVDDSEFFRQRIQKILETNPEISVVGMAKNGQEGVEKASALKPDLITMDYEMPIMDGIAAVKQIMHDRPVPILMFSSLTFEGARITLDALAAGAADFLLKSFSSVSQKNNFNQELCDRILSLARKQDLTPRIKKLEVSKSISARHSDKGSYSQFSMSHTTTQKKTVYSKPLNSVLKSRPKLIVIGASTGGPVALQTVLEVLPADFPVPIVLVQHMPETFTKAYAQRMDSICRVQVKEAAEGDCLKPGLVLVAPGGCQLLIGKQHKNTVSVIEGGGQFQYKPCVDVTFGSCAKAWPGEVLAIVMTGMGSDGREGARLLKKTGSTVWVQDQKSCVVYGMPMSVKMENLADAEMPLKDIGRNLIKEIMRGSS